MAAPLKQRHITLVNTDDAHRFPTLEPLPPIGPSSSSSLSNKDQQHQQQQLLLKKKLHHASLKRPNGALQGLVYDIRLRHPRASAWLFYLAFLFMLVVVSFRLHYALPTPVSSEEGATVDPSTGQLRFSEENVRKTVRYLSEDIGYRVVGTEQDQDTQIYLIKELQYLKEQAQKTSARQVGAGALVDPMPNFDMWIQVEDGAHQFDFMSKVVMKMYTNMTNIIVRLSCGPECDTNSILLNAHYDTTLGSPGAVDDALPVGVMLEMIRILSQRPALKKNSLIFLFNGGEESLQDASHSFITLHELRHSVRAVINLEGCGTSGPEILFQANSQPMIEAYRRVPYPHGTVMGNDLFSTGIILSDTDFRQFVEYGNLTGLDMAVYKNSYLYHTHLDLDAHMEQGLPQHLGENTLTLATYLGDQVDLQENMEQTKSVVYFDVFGQFFVSYSMDTAILSHIAVGGLVILSVVMGASRPTVRSVVSVVLSLVAALLTPSLTALTLQSLGKTMVWFTHEWLPIAIFGPLGAAAMLAVQMAFHDKKASRGTNELQTFSAIQMLYTVTMAIGSWARIASSYFLATYAFLTTAALLFNHRQTNAQRRAGHMTGTGVDYTTYFVAAGPLTLWCSYLAFSLLDLIVPLTGRIGVDAPVDHIMAIMTGFCVFSFSPSLLAFSHRFGRKSLKRIVTGLVVLQVAVIVWVSVFMSPYDEMHPKRVFVQHLRNLTSGESLMYVAHADAGPFYAPYVSPIESLLDTKATFKSGGENPGDWNAVYPFNQFLDSYVFDTTPYIRKHTTNETLAKSKAPLTDLIHSPPRLVAEKVSYDAARGVRKLTMLCTHPEYIWTVMSFDAEVVSWSMALAVPSKERFHYVVRNAGGYRTDGWRLEVEYKASGIDDKLRVELTAMETEGFGKDVERELEGSGEIGLMRKVVKARPVDVTLTYFSAVLSNFDL
ncbi:hypothetical protein BGZ98_007445 [Dissophora globulifera]|nr:hypothetical protein BGZ98_007445 [Dissophora globulifera]